MYSLNITIGYSVGSCHDSRNRTMEEDVSAKTLEEAVEKSRRRVKEICEQYKHLTDFSLGATLQEVRTVWDTFFQEAEAYQPAIPAREAKPERFEERVFIKPQEG